MAEETWGAYLARLDREATAGLKEALRYYLGPTGIPDKLNVLAPVAASMLPGVGEGMDMQDAANASSRLWAEPSLPNALALVPPTVALAVPGISNRLAQGLTDVGGDIAATARRFPGDEFGGVGPKGTPAQQIAELLASGRGDEVTDDLMAQADPQEMWRLYESGATGVDMPMDAASRMARAQEMGFGGDLYHGTTADFKAFDSAKDLGGGARGAGVYASTSHGTSNLYALRGDAQRMDLRPEGDGSVIPLRGRGPVYDESAILPSADVNRLEAADDAISVARGMGNYTASAQGLPSLSAGFDSGFPAHGSSVLERLRWGNEALDGAGYAGRSGPAVAGGGEDVVFFDPRNIRSRFARFDPRLAHLSNLSAATVPFMFGGLNALAGYDEQQ